MRYLLLIYSDETAENAMSEKELNGILQAYGKFTSDLESSGALRAGERLQPSTTATTVRVRKGDRLTTDGPFAETKEQLGGYYIIDVPDLDAALAWAAKIPSATYGSIEVRPIWEM